MGKQINVLGYSFWISDNQPESDEKIASNKRFYSPSILAAYCILSNLFVGIILYGINISRRGYLWRGRVLILLSGLILVTSQILPILESWHTVRSRFLLNGLVAISLYTSEKPHFQRAIRHGNQQARWWLPLIWLGLFCGISFLLNLVIT